MRTWIAVGLAALSFAATAAEPTAQELNKMISKLMESTKLNVRMGISVPVAQLKSDGDPNTLELVFLDKAEPGANTVSEDGEMIFLFNPTDEVQSRLIAKAFETRARRRLAAAEQVQR